MADGGENVGTSDQPHSPTKEDLSKCFAKYDMDDKKRLVAYIFNHENFKNNHPESREGSSKDTEAFIAALIKLGFSERDVTVFKDKTADEMLNAFKNVNEVGTRNPVGCFVCAIMSHGRENDQLCAYDRDVGLYDLLSCLTPVKCPSLRKVPKLIFVQACRGGEIDEGACVTDGPETEVNETLSNIPIMPDLLVFHSSYNKYSSFRNETNGSCFMKTLSKALSEFGTERELLTLLTAVSYYVASEKFETKRNPELEEKQMPQIMSTLLKQLKFEPRRENASSKAQLYSARYVAATTTMDAVSGDGNTGAKFHLPTEEDLMKCFDKYDMKHIKRGVVYIFNNENFKDSKKLPTRHGSSKDTEDFKTALIHLGFHETDINVYTDATKKEMFGALEDFHNDNPDIKGNIDCFICAILSHGGENDIIYGYEGEVELDEMLSYLRPDRCPSLTGIPKLIFIQACRGSKIDVGVEKKDGFGFGFEEKPPKIPIMADMLVFHSSYKEYPSIRDKQKGSWFMQTLSKVLKKYGAEYEIMKLLAAVCNHVATLEYQSLDNPEYDSCKQMPQIMSTLRKELKFELRM
ncbi:caspase-1-like isoform X2 [Octopus vulgaris]|uniref:Caspase-1-like isoform X2 n=1 Tax=Octopus vulgaris TaxID=6645 RepID=A0AA36BZI4_OCTVU|nr:caspase-1-like isoform X2 [Octopus vulgaris]